MRIAENELIESAKIYFKERGFKKTGKRWTKERDKFKLVFFVQGSAYSKDAYYIRSGVFIRDLEKELSISPYGHFSTQIEVNTLPQIFADTENFLPGGRM